MPKRTRPYRDALMVALKDPEEAVHYLNAALDESPQLFFKALLDVIQAGANLTEIAKQAGVQRETIYRAFQEQGNPTAETLFPVLDAMNLKLVVAPKEHQQQS